MLSSISFLFSEFAFNKVNLVFRTSNIAANSILLWNGGSIHDDFIAIGIKDRNVELHVNLGDGILSLVAQNILINFNQLYSVSFER